MLVRVTVISLVLFMLLVSGSLVKAARAREPGWERTVAIGAAGAIDRVSNLLSLNRPLDAANAWLHREDVEPELTVAPTTTAVPGEPATTTTTIVPTLATLPGQLRVGIYGDSMAMDLARSMQKQAVALPRVEITDNSRTSTGLARPDYYNWPARLAELLAAKDRDVVVFGVGGNDAQNLQNRLGKGVGVIGTPEWEAGYRERVTQIMDPLNNGRRRLIWMLPPPVRSAEMQATIDVMTRVSKEEAAKRPWVTLIDPGPTVTDPQGRYQDFITVAGQTPQRCRKSDGIHLATACQDRVATVVLNQL